MGNLPHQLVNAGFQPSTVWFPDDKRKCRLSKKKNKAKLPAQPSAAPGGKAWIWQIPWVGTSSSWFYGLAVFTTKSQLKKYRFPWILHTQNEKNRGASQSCCGEDASTPPRWSDIFFVMYFVFQSYRTVDLVATRFFFATEPTKRDPKKQPTQSVKRVFRMDKNWKLIKYTSKPSAKICVSFQTNHYEGWRLEHLAWRIIPFSKWLKKMLNESPK